MLLATIMAAPIAPERRIAYYPWRPPTAVYPDRHKIAHFRDEQFPPTASSNERILMINLEGVFLSPGALMDMILPVARSVRSGVYGPTSLLVITSDDATIEFLESMAERHDLSLFVSPSSNKPLSEARPIGALTTTEADTLSLVRQSGGVVTSSRIADLAGIEPNAAVNRVTGLVRKRYLHRVSRSRSEGDTFVDLLSAPSAAEKPIRSGPDIKGILSSHGEFRIPEDVREGVLMLAAMQGSEPSEVLVQAWREFLTHHRELLDTDSKEVGRMIREQDTAGLATYAGRHARERAKQAVSRTKR